MQNHDLESVCNISCPWLVRMICLVWNHTLVHQEQKHIWKETFVHFLFILWKLYC